MHWTNEQIEQIPKVYRDFLLTLRPVLESERSGLKINGIPRGTIYSVLRMNRHPYDLDEIARKLKEASLIDGDRLGFYWPTPKGEALIREMIGEAVPATAPDLPPL